MLKKTLAELVNHPAKVVVFLFYLIGSLIFGEFHPFSKFPMYSSFPNWSYCFFLKNTAGDTLFWKQELGVIEGSVSHMYSSSSQYKNIRYGFGMESRSELEIMGNLIMKQVTENLPKSSTKDTLSLYRKHFSVQSDSIHEETKLMCTYYVE